MNHLALLIGSYLAIASQQDPTALNASLSDWESYKAQYGKQYDNAAVEAMRMANFFHNKRRIDEFNRSPEAQNFTLELNHLADMSEHEMMPRNSFKRPRERKIINDISIEDSSYVPDELDWRLTPGVVSRVKDQGTNCSSSYAFATTGLLEAQERLYFRRNVSDFVELSEQNIIDCSIYTDGCNGGYVGLALLSIKEQFGLEDEKSYPYEGKEGKCRFDANNVAIYVTQFYTILPTEDILKQAVATYGPMAVKIHAGPKFQSYKEGVYYDKDCKNTIADLNHDVLVVGYGTDPKGGDYWLVKNSYGEKWGEKGYIRMARNRDNNCGIITEVSCYDCVRL